MALLSLNRLRRVYGTRGDPEIKLNSITDVVIFVAMHGHVDCLNIAAKLMTGWRGARLLLQQAC
jgi:hypothetical protein